MNKGLLFVLTGASSVGKKDIRDRLLGDEQLHLNYSISMTTRPKREEEVDGKDYYFVNHEAFAQALRNRELLEYTEFDGYYYGTPKLTAALAFAFAVYLYLWVKKRRVENKKIQEVSALIKEGANTFMRREYKILAIFAGIAAVVIFVLLPSPVWKGDIVQNISMTVAYILGTALSAVAGKIGILVATLSNGRAAEGAQKGIKPAFLIGFRGGAVMGLLVVGCSLLGVAAVLLIAGDATILLGFSFGASSLALFAKAGGGIFTKTADVSADLTGKVELGIPEDDPRNPAVIADNVGDNVGDVAGMAFCYQ